MNNQQFQSAFTPHDPLCLSNCGLTSARCDCKEKRCWGETFRLPCDPVKLAHDYNEQLKAADELKEAVKAILRRTKTSRDPNDSIQGIIGRFHAIHRIASDSLAAYEKVRGLKG